MPVLQAGNVASARETQRHVVALHEGARIDGGQARRTTRPSANKCSRCQIPALTTTSTAARPATITAAQAAGRGDAGAVEAAGATALQPARQAPGDDAHDQQQDARAGQPDGLLQQRHIQLVVIQNQVDQQHGLAPAQQARPAQSKPSRIHDRPKAMPGRAASTPPAPRSPSGTPTPGAARQDRPAAVDQRPRHGDGQQGSQDQIRHGGRMHPPQGGQLPHRHAGGLQGRQLATSARRPRPGLQRVASRRGHAFRARKAAHASQAPPTQAGSQTARPRTMSASIHVRTCSYRCRVLAEKDVNMKRDRATMTPLRKRRIASGART